MSEISRNTLSDQPAIVAFEKHYTVADIARTWQAHPSTVRRIFRDLPGVIDLSLNGRKQNLRIPQSVLDQVVAERSKGFEPRQRRGRAV